MIQKLLRITTILGLIALVGGLGSADVLRADDDRERGGRRPSQVRPSGFEGTDRLLDDVERAERAPLYSAWIVESSRSMNFRFGSFQPDKAGLNTTVNLPVNVGIIEGPDGKLTLYDSGWKQLAYIFDWNTSCCWWGIRNQLTAIGHDPTKVTRIVLGHGHWDHAGQLSEFPNAVVYIQKEELKQIDFFLHYPVDFNGGHIRAVNTVHALTGAQMGPPHHAGARSAVCGYPPQTGQEILAKMVFSKPEIVSCQDEIAQGLGIQPSFRGHT